MERLVFKQVYEYLEVNNLIYEHQFDLRPGYSGIYWHQLVEIFHSTCHP
jgi:hypothetical protein